MDNKFLKQLFNLDKMLSASIILWVYRIGLVLIPLIMLIAGISNGFGSFLLSIILVPVVLVFFRLNIEFMYVIFGLYDKVSSIEKIKKDSSNNS